MEATYKGKKQFEAQVRQYKDRWNEQLVAIGEDTQGTRPAERRVTGLAVMQHMAKSAEVANWDVDSGIAEDPEKLKRLYVWAFEMLRDTAVLRHNEDVRKARQAHKKDLPVRDRSNDTTAWKEVQTLNWRDINHEQFHNIVKNIWTQYWAIGRVPITEYEYQQTERILLEEVMGSQAAVSPRIPLLKFPSLIMKKAGMSFTSDKNPVDAWTEQTRKEVELAMASFATATATPARSTAPVAPRAQGTAEQDRGRTRQQELTDVRQEAQQHRAGKSKARRAQSSHGRQRSPSAGRQGDRRQSRGREREPRSTQGQQVGRRDHRQPSGKRNGDKPDSDVKRKSARTQSPGNRSAQGVAQAPPPPSLLVKAGVGRGRGLDISQQPQASAPLPLYGGRGILGPVPTGPPPGGAKPKTAPLAVPHQASQRKVVQDAAYYARLDKELAEEEVVPVTVQPAHPPPPPYAVLNRVPDPVANPAAFIQWRKTELCKQGHAPFEAEMQAVPFDPTKESLQEFAQMIVASVDLALAATSTDKFKDGAIGGPCIHPALQAWKIGPEGVPDHPVNKDIRNFNHREHWVRYMRILQLWAEKSGLVTEGEFAQVTYYVWRRLGGIMCINRKDILKDERWTIIYDGTQTSHEAQSAPTAVSHRQRTESESTAMEVSQTSDDVLIEEETEEVTSKQLDDDGSLPPDDGPPALEGEEIEETEEDISMTVEEMDEILDGTGTPAETADDEGVQVYVEVGVPQPGNTEQTTQFARKNKEMYDAACAIVAKSKERGRKQRMKELEEKERKAEEKREAEHWRKLREEVHAEQARDAKRAQAKPQGVSESKTEVLTRLDRSGKITQVTSQTDTNLVTGVSTKETKVETMQLPMTVTVPSDEGAARIVELTEEQHSEQQEEDSDDAIGDD